jgi:hypothetical protein
LYFLTSENIGSFILGFFPSPDCSSV